MYLLPFFAVLGSLLLLLPVRLRFSLGAVIENNGISINVECRKWSKKLEISRQDMSIHQAESVLRENKKLLSRLSFLRQDVGRERLFNFIKSTLSAMEINELNVEVAVGCGDAMQTALWAGTVWAITGWIKGILSRSKIKQAVLVVSPLFSDEGLMIRSGVNVSLRLYRILLLLARIWLFKTGNRLRTNMVYSQSRPVIL